MAVDEPPREGARFRTRPSFTPYQSFSRALAAHAAVTARPAAAPEPLPPLESEPAPITELEQVASSSESEKHPEFHLEGLDALEEQIGRFRTISIRFSRRGRLRLRRSRFPPFRCSFRAETSSPPQPFTASLPVRWTKYQCLSPDPRQESRRSVTKRGRSARHPGGPHVAEPSRRLHRSRIRFCRSLGLMPSFPGRVAVRGPRKGRLLPSAGQRPCLLFPYRLRRPIRPRPSSRPRGNTLLPQPSPSTYRHSLRPPTRGCAGWRQPRYARPSSRPASGCSLRGGAAVVFGDLSVACVLGSAAPMDPTWLFSNSRRPCAVSCPSSPPAPSPKAGPSHSTPPPRWPAGKSEAFFSQ